MGIKGQTKEVIIKILTEANRPLTVFDVQERLPLDVDLEISAIYVSVNRLVKLGKVVKTKTKGHYRAFYSLPISRTIEASPVKFIGMIYTNKDGSKNFIENNNRELDDIFNT